MKRRSFLRYGAGGLGLAAVSATVGCGDDDDDSPGGSSPATGNSTAAPGATAGPTEAFELAPVQETTQRYFNDLLRLDPATIFGIEQENIALQTFSGLTVYNGKTEVAADIATGWEQPDNLTYTFKLHTAKWHGEYGDFTAEDVVWSYNRVIEGGGTYAKEFGLVDSVTALDPQTVQIKLSKPDANFPHQVTNYHQGSILNARAVEAMGDLHWATPIGTGPYMVSDNRPGTGFVLNAFDGYFKGAPTIKKHTFRRIDDFNTAAIALKNSEIDVYMAVRNEAALDTLEGDNNIEYSIGDQWGISLWIFNTTVPELADPRVRQAMAYAVDFPAAIKATAPRIQSPANNIVPSWIAEYSSDVPEYTHDLAEARRLLDAAGVDKLNLKYMTTAGSEFVTLLQASWAQVGINVELELTDRAQFNSRRVTGDYQLTVRGYPAANIDQILFNYLHPDNFPPNGFNGSRYNNPDVVAKMEQARSELNLETRKSLYADIQKQVMTDLPYLITNASNEYWAFRKNIKGIVCNKMPQVTMYDMSVAKA